MSPNEVHGQILGITSKLIQLGLCNEQNYPSLRRLRAGLTEIAIVGALRLSVSMKDIEYREIYSYSIAVRAITSA